MIPEPIFDLAHLGHMELLTPKPDESLKFFVDVMGMTVSGQKGESVYLRGWDDYERYSLKLTASNTSGMEHMALRARSPQALERRVAALKGTEFEIGWTEGDLGHGPAFRCRDPDGHIVELYYETEWYQAPPELKPALKNQAQRFPARGINVRRLDHLNCLAVDIKANRIFFETYLGCRLTEQILPGQKVPHAQASCEDGHRWSQPSQPPPRTAWRLMVSYWRIATAERPIEAPQARAARRARQPLDPKTVQAMARQPLRPIEPQQPLDIGLFEFRPPEAPHIVMPDE